MKSDWPLKLKLTALCLRVMPLCLRRALVCALAMAGYHLLFKHRIIALHNLARSFPGKSINELLAIAKASYKSFALITAEFSDIIRLSRETLSQWGELHGLKNYEKALSEGKGVLLIGGHFGNWEYGLASLALLSQPPVFMGRKMDSAFIEEGIRRGRALLGIRTLNKEGALRPTLRLLKEGQAVVVLIDQNVAATEGVFVNFFGRPACTTTGVALMALRTGAAVLPFFTTRMPDGRYRADIGEPISLVKTGDLDADVRINTQRYTAAVEAQVRQYPAQWFWIHQRWKTKLCQLPKTGTLS